jgi:hypothetical protein
MLLCPRTRVLPRRGLEQHLLDPLSGEILLREREAAVEHFQVALDQPVRNWKNEMPSNTTGLPSAPGMPEA